MRRVRNILFALATAGLIMACGLGSAPSASGGTVATAVASTLQALTPAASTSTPTANDNTLAGVPVQYKNVSFTIPTVLAIDAAPMTIAATTEQDGGPWGIAPEHIEFRLDGYNAPANSFNVERIDVYPAEEYSNRYAGANVSLQRLKGALKNPAASLNNDTLPQVPYFNAASMFSAQIKRIHFANGDGIRVVTAYAQSYAAISNDGTFYHFEGLTSDGKYYLIAVLPVQAPILQKSNDPNSQAPAGGVPFPGYGSTDPATYSDYYNAVTEKLNSVAADQFTPSLEALDALMQSFKVSP